MLKIKKAKLSGFRGINKPQELDFKEGSASSRSLVIYGLNSSGKSSFVDGFEWFFAADNQIEWLRRSEAEERAYPHQEAKDGESFVEIEFEDSDNKVGTLTLQRMREFDATNESLTNVAHLNQGAALHPSYSSDGRSIVFDSNGQIWKSSNGTAIQIINDNQENSYPIMP